jgi:hypothetical protein
MSINVRNGEWRRKRSLFDPPPPGVEGLVVVAKLMSRYPAVPAQAALLLEKVPHILGGRADVAV